jgi:hypothetical protein
VLEKVGEVQFDGSCEKLRIKNINEKRNIIYRALCRVTMKNYFSKCIWYVHGKLQIVDVI